MSVKKAHGMIANWEEADTGWWGFIFPGRGCSEAARALAHHIRGKKRGSREKHTGPRRLYFALGKLHTYIYHEATAAIADALRSPDCSDSVLVFSQLAPALVVRALKPQAPLIIQKDPALERGYIIELERYSLSRQV